jgi:hypothetical protein
MSRRWSGRYHELARVQHGPSPRERAPSRRSARLPAQGRPSSRLSRYGESVSSHVFGTRSRGRDCLTGGGRDPCCPLSMRSALRGIGLRLRSGRPGANGTSAVPWGANDPGPAWGWPGVVMTVRVGCGGSGRLQRRNRSLVRRRRTLHQARRSCRSATSGPRRPSAVHRGP